MSLRIYFMTTQRPKTIAKKLKRAAKAAGIELKLENALEAVAKMYGYAHWHELHSSIGSGTPSLMDGDVSDEEVTARRGYQSRILAEELAIEIDIAAALVDAVPPTGPFSGIASESSGQGKEDFPQDGPRYW